jgi:hypothetical protein
MSRFAAGVLFALLLGAWRFAAVAGQEGGDLVTIDVTVVDGAGTCDRAAAR